MIRLLLVEDDANLSYMIQAALEDMIGDYEVTIANNGQEGLEAYRQDKPDVIVADIEMLAQHLYHNPVSCIHVLPTIP